MAECSVFVPTAFVEFFEILRKKVQAGNEAI